MALREIGAKLTLEGEAEWKKEMDAADRELKNLNSELAATSAEFDGQANSMEALSAKQRIQTELVAQQREKLRALETAVEDATSAWGADAKQTDKIRQSYNYARKSLASMEANLKTTEDLLDEASKSADGCATSIDEFGKKTEETTSKLDLLADNEALDRVSDAAKEVLDVLKDCIEEAIKYEQETVDAMGEAGEGIETTQDKISAAEESLKSLKIAVGEALLPAVGEAADGLGDLADSLADFASAHPEVIEAVSGLTAGIVAATTALAGLKAAQAAIAAIGTLASPLGAVVVALGAIAAGITAVAAARAELKDEATLGDGAEIEDYAANVEALRAEYEALEAQRQQLVDSGADFSYLDDELSAAALRLKYAEEELTEQTSEEAIAAREQAAAHEAAEAELTSTNDAVQDAVSKLAELQATYDAIRTSVDSVVTGFTNLSGATEQYATTSDEMIAALESQLAYMDTYKENLLAAQELGLSDALIEELSDGSTQSAAYLQAIVDDGGAHIAELNSKFAEVSQGKDSFVDTIAETLPGFTATMDQIKATLDSSVASWNQNAAAQAAGVNTIEGLMSGLNRYSEIFALGVQMGQAFEAGYRSATQQHSPSRVMMKLMDNTVEGALIEGKKRLSDMRALGESLGESLISGYEASPAPSPAMLAAAASASARPVTVLSAPRVSGSDTGGGAGADIAALLQQNLDMMDKMQRLTVVLDTGETVGGLAGGMDEALGERYTRSEGGLAL